MLDSLHEIDAPFVGGFIEEDDTENEGGKDGNSGSDTSDESSTTDVTRTRVGGGEG